MNLDDPATSGPSDLAVTPPLDPAFQPLALSQAHYAHQAQKSPQQRKAVLALERQDEQRTTLHLDLLPAEHDRATEAYLERVVKFLLWQVGGWKLTFAGPPDLGKRLADSYSPNGSRAFDVDLMRRVYDRPFCVEICEAEEAPSSRETGVKLGGHLDGCRLGFDLGASDYKLAAVKEGEAVFTTEIPWDPKNEPDPEVHYRKIHEGLELAASHLPRVDAIGGSAAGIYMNNEVRVASLFRAVPEAVFAEKVRSIFHRLQSAWQVPLEVANDGDVTALAAAMALRVQGILGIAMGSSQAVGYLDPQGRITGWLNELAFAPVDANPDAPTDEWSGDRGVGALYFSQQAAGRLLTPAGIQLETDVPLPEKLKFLQSLMQGSDTRAERVYQTIGVYLGYALAQYSAFYDYRHALLLGRVTSGPGADLILTRAKTVLNQVFPKLADRLQLHLPDEQTKRVGQAVAAASLPTLPSC